MLPRTAAAALDDRARRQHARAPGADHAHQLGAHEAALGLDDAHHHAVARRAAGDEDDAPVGVAPDRLAAERQRVEGQLELARAP